MKIPSAKHWLRSGAALLVCALLASCVSTGATAGSGQPLLFEWPGLDERETELLDYASFHNVRIFIEVDPGEPALGLPDFDLQNGAEIYRLPGGHELVFSQGAFHVGDYRYFAPQSVARRGRDRARRYRETARLWIFQPRDGTFAFRFRGEPVIVESRRPWTPSVYYLREQGVDAQGPWLQETLQVGLAEIRTSSKTPRLWLVDGTTYNPRENDRLVLRGAVEFKGN